MYGVELPDLEPWAYRSKDPLPQDAYLLDVWAIRDSRGAWWLDAGRILDYLASGGSVADISRFLAEKCQNELPETLEGRLSGIVAKASAVKGIEQALLIEVCDAAGAAAIAGHVDAGMLCRHAGEKHLVVATKNLRTFRNALKKLGYALPENELQPRSGLQLVGPLDHGCNVRAFPIQASVEADPIGHCPLEG
jgi:hypothetical protein